MQKVQNIFPVAKLETNPKIIGLAENRGQIYCRIAIVPTGDESTLTEAQKKLLAKLSDKQKNTTLKGQLEREISNVFPLAVFADYVDGLEALCTDAEYFGDESQEELVKQVSDLVVGENFIFTYYTEQVSALLQGTEHDGVSVLYADTESNGVRPIRSRNNLYFGFFDNEEEVFSFMQSRLLSDIEDENLILENPNGTDETTEKPTENPTSKPKLPKLTLKK